MIHNNIKLTPDFKHVAKTKNREKMLRHIVTQPNELLYAHCIHYDKRGQCVVAANGRVLVCIPYLVTRTRSEFQHEFVSADGNRHHYGEELPRFPDWKSVVPRYGQEHHVNADIETVAAYCRAAIQTGKAVYINIPDKQGKPGIYDPGELLLTCTALLKTGHRDFYFFCDHVGPDWHGIRPLLIRRTDKLFCVVAPLRKSKLTTGIALAQIGDQHENV